MKIFVAAAFTTSALIGAVLAQAGSQGLPPFDSRHPPPFTATFSNNLPLVFGMDAEDAARALGTPLNYVSGRPGDEIFMTFRHAGGSGLFPIKDRLYLQFRKSRLVGWEGE